MKAPSDYSTASTLRSLVRTHAVRLFPVSVAVAALLSLAIALLQRWLQPPSEHSGTVLLAAAGGLVATLACAGARTPAAAPRSLDERGFTAWVLALELGILLLPIAAYLAVWRNVYDSYAGWTYPFFNKRWLVALYGIGVATFLVFPSALDKWLGREVRLTTESALPPPLRSRRLWQLVPGLVVAALLSWFLAGPPWNVERHHRPIDFHEQVHLGPLQAIDKGYLPYVGPASTQYGPGSQLLTYRWMKMTGRFDVVSFREAAIAFHLAAVATVAVLASILVGFWSMPIVVLIGLSYSPLALYFVFGDGTFGGLYGWGNELRYLGSLLVVPALARVASRDEWRTGSIWQPLALGVVWGFFAWVSQENLGTTLVASTLILLIIWATDTAPARQVLGVAAWFIAGFAAVWTLILAYYAWHGAAAAFVRAYVLVASAVAMGFSNSWWNPTEAPGHNNAFYYTAPFVIALGVAALCDVRTLALRTRLDGRHVQFLAFVCVLLACYQASLYRSDNTHLMNTMLALPFVLVLSARDVPAWIARTWPGRAAARVAIVGAALVIYPIRHVLADPYAWVIRPASARFALPDAPQTIKDGRVPFRRAGRYLADEPVVAAGMVPMRTFLEAASDLHDLIGARRTYVDGVIAGGYTGLYYFMLDLVPGPTLYEKETMTIHNGIAEDAFEHFRRHIAEFDAVLTSAPDSRESVAFRAAHPGAVTIERSIGPATVYVILGGGT